MSPRLFSAARRRAVPERRRLQGLPVRRAALEILIRVEQERAFADVLLGQRLDPFRPVDRRLLTKLVLGTLAWRGRLDYELARFLGRSLAKVDPMPLMIMRLGLYQLRFLSRVPKHAAVNTAVALAKEVPVSRAAAGMVNAVLRRAAQSVVPLPERARDEAGYLALAWSHPRWIVERFLEWFGAAGAESLLAADNEAAPNVIRLNLARGSRIGILGRLQAEGFDFEPLAWLPETVILRSAPKLDSAAWTGGLFHIQSAASQMVSRLLAPAQGALIADCAAAPGGKSSHLAELAGPGGKVVALDRSHRGLIHARSVCDRLGHRNVAFVCADLAAAPPLRQRRFDAVLLDAPCTGLGTLREHPEIRWRLEPADIARMATVQAEMLRSASLLVRPGGALVYAVCSLAPEEGIGVVKAFLESHREFELDRRPPIPADFKIPLEGGLLRTRPDRFGLDGFFAARLKRR